VKLLIIASNLEILNSFRKCAPFLKLKKGAKIRNVTDQTSGRCHIIWEYSAGYKYHQHYGCLIILCFFSKIFCSSLENKKADP
jgi:hypothetical protein